MTEKQNIFWNTAAKYGLVLGAITTGYYLINLMIASLDVGTGIRVVLNLLTFVLWAAKLYYCLKVLKTSMQKYSILDGEADNMRVFRFGMAVAIFSALISSAVSLADTIIIRPDTIDVALDTIKNTEGITEAMMNEFEKVLPSMPTYMFVLNLIYCFLFGTIASAIYSKNIPSSNPFNKIEE